MTYPVRTSTGKIQYGHTVHFSCDVGHTIDMGGFGCTHAVDRFLVQVVSSCFPLKYTLPSAGLSSCACHSLVVTTGGLFIEQ